MSSAVLWTVSRLSLLCLSAAAGCADPPSHGVIPLHTHAPSANAPVAAEGGPGVGDLPSDGILHLAYAPVATELDQSSWQPLVDRLVRRLGVLVEPVPYDSYEAILVAVEQQDTDLALLAPLTYVLARDTVPELTPLVHSLSEGKTSYSAYLFVERSSDYHDLTDLRGGRIAFVDERSTSGFLLPYAQLLDAGISPERDLAELIFTGDHVGALRAVAEGRADAAASYADVLPWATQVAQHEGWDMPVFRLLGTSGRLPLDVLCAAPTVAPGMQRVLEAELLRANTSSGSTSSLRTL